MVTPMSSLSSKPSRGAVLTAFAVLFVVLAISNLSKPFHLDSGAGFVFFGVKTSGIANDILGPVFGVWLLVYAIRFECERGHTTAKTTTPATLGMKEAPFPSNWIRDRACPRG